MSITMQGLELVDGQLRTVENAEDRLPGPMERGVDILYGRVQSTTPVDTGRLAGNLDRRVESSGTTVSGSVFFNETYGPYGHRYDHYVKGEGQQAYMHRGRVPHLGDDLEAVRPQIEALFADVVEDLAGG